MIWLTENLYEQLDAYFQLFVQSFSTFISEFHHMIVRYISANGEQTALKPVQW